MNEGFILPDGSGFAVVSIRLPEDHWSYQTDVICPPESLKVFWNLLPKSDQDECKIALIQTIRYAIRTTTGYGQLMDFNPHDLINHFWIGALGSIPIPVNPEANGKWDWIDDEVPDPAPGFLKGYCNVYSGEQLESCIEGFWMALKLAAKYAVIQLVSQGQFKDADPDAFLINLKLGAFGETASVVHVQEEGDVNC